MGKDPAFLFYPNDWIGGTMGMTFEEKGAYMEVLMMQFNRGHMTEHMISQTIGHLWVNIKVKFMQDEEGLWYNDRLDIEKERRKNYVKSRNNNKLGKNKDGKSKSKEDGHMTSHMENENEDYNTLHNLQHNQVRLIDQEKKFQNEKINEDEEDGLISAKARREIAERYQAEFYPNSSSNVKS